MFSICHNICIGIFVAQIQRSFKGEIVVWYDQGLLKLKADPKDFDTGTAYSCVFPISVGYGVLWRSKRQHKSLM